MAVSLGELTLSPRHHLSALWWLGLLYRRPKQVTDALAELPRGQALLAGTWLLVNALPYVFVLGIVGRLLVEPGRLLDLATTGGAEQLIQGIAGGIVGGIVLGITCRIIAGGIAVRIADGIAAGIAVGIADGIAGGIAGVIAVGIVFGIPGGIAVGIAVGIADGIAGRIAGVIAVGIVFGIPGGIAVGIAVGISVGIGAGIALGILVAIVVGIPVGIAGGIAVGIAFGIAVGIAFGIAVGIAFGIALLRAYYYPAHALFVFPVARPRWYRFHPLAWDDLCSLPFLGLHRLLVAYAEMDASAAEREIDRLISEYPSQRMEALKARTILIARAAARERNLASLDARLSSLPHGDEGFLKQVPEVRTLVGEIAQLQRRLDTMQRPAFREPVAAQLVTAIENFHHQVAGFREPLATEFRKAAEGWQRVAQEQVAVTRGVLAREPTAQVFRAGDPVDRIREAFVPRMPVIEELEGQIMLASGCPGLLVYGRRRMGKSTLLRNLEGFLPGSVLTARFSMQNPSAFTSPASFASLVARTAREAVGNAPSAAAPETLPALFDALTDINKRLEESDRRLILACDEFEAIDGKIGEGVFSLDLLSTIRESVQTHRRVTWVFAGSHDLGELEHADWSSYFVSLRTVQVLPFSPEETLLLLTEPLKWSPLWQDRPAERPRFDPSFWGEDGIERIQEETGGWPHLLQLVAETAVDIANDKAVRELDADLLEAAFTKAVGRGDVVLRQLLKGENRYPCEWDYLLAFRDRECQPPPPDPDVRRALRRRLLVMEKDGQWRMRVPLMRRWLKDRC